MSRNRVSWSSKALVVAMAATFFFSSCAYTTRINTSPEGAKIWVNGMYLGEGPQPYKYRSGLPETYIVELSKDGFKRQTNVTIDRSLRADASLFLLLLAIVPYFFSARLEEQYNFTMEPLQPEATPAPAQ